MRECLTVCMSLNSPTVVDAICKSDCCMLLAQRFTELYACLSPQAEDEELQSHLAFWTMTRPEKWLGWQDKKHQGMPPESQDFFRFMDWIHFCDDLCWKANKEIAKSFSSHVLSALRLSVGQMLSQQSEHVATTTTMYLTACVTQITAPQLLNAFSSFLIGNSDETDLSVEAEALKDLPSLIINRCNDISEELSAVTLHLFLQFLSKRKETVLQGLVLKHIQRKESDNSPDLVAVLQDTSKRLMASVPDELRSADDEESYRAYFIDAQEQVVERKHYTMHINFFFRQITAIKNVGSGQVGDTF
eukprot:m.262212 g.262212  ORF g.262212 m.262212 type:complete len:303 (+) comp16222_c1_seq8:6525-7433(+)